MDWHAKLSQLEETAPSKDSINFSVSVATKSRVLQRNTCPSPFLRTKKLTDKLSFTFLRCAFHVIQIYVIMSMFSSHTLHHPSKKIFSLKQLNDQFKYSYIWGNSEGEAIFQQLCILLAPLIIKPNYINRKHTDKNKSFKMY